MDTPLMASVNNNNNIWTIKSVNILVNNNKFIVIQFCCITEIVGLYLQYTNYSYMNYIGLATIRYLGIIVLWDAPWYSGSRSNIVVSELQSRYYVHFRSNTLRKGMDPLIPPSAIG